jgi:hypothetical protein
MTFSWKGHGTKQSWPTLRYYPDIFLERQEKHEKVGHRTSKIWTWDSSEYAGVLSAQPAMQWLRRLVTSLSLWRFVSAHVGFVVDRVTLGQVFLRVLQFPNNIIHHGSPYSYIIWGDSLEAAVQRYSVTPSTWMWTSAQLLWYMLVLMVI